MYSYEQIRKLLADSPYAMRNFEVFEKRGLKDQFVYWFNEFIVLEYATPEGAFHFCGVKLLDWPVGG